MSDHKEQAEDVYAIDLTPENEAVVVALDQLRHATMYAAEQQKRVADEAHISNLIEVGRDRDRQLDRELNDPEYQVLDGSTLRVSVSTELLERSNEIKALIREGLGLS